MMLSPEELLNLLKRLVPGAGKSHARYLQLMLDGGGGGKPSGRGCHSCNSTPCTHTACSQARTRSRSGRYPQPISRSCIYFL